MRKLASIQRINALFSPIKGADKIEVANVLGWQIVVKKNEFNVGDLCVYVEIDSILPELPEFEFLRTKKFKVKTIKLRGQVSQGICFPISILPNGITPKEEDDVTETLNICKYESDDTDETDNISNTSENPSFFRRIKKFILPWFFKKHHKKGPVFPGYLHKTDETRIQTILRILNEVKDKQFYITKKLDGTSCTISHYKIGLFQYEDFICSRNTRRGPDSVYGKIEKRYDILRKLRKLGNYAVQGEICGPKIQGNKLGLKKENLFLFNVYDINKKKYLNYQDFIKFAEKIGVPTVPILNDNFYFNNETLDDLLKMAEGKYPGTNNEQEGLVFRPTIETYSEVLKGRMSFKVISNRYLLKEEGL